MSTLGLTSGALMLSFLDCFVGVENCYHWYIAFFTVNATTGDVATGAVVIDILSTAAIATVTAADTDASTGHMLFSAWLYHLC